VTTIEIVAACLVLLPVPGPRVALALPDTTRLQFLGFRAGARLDELAFQLDRLGGSRMRCRRSSVDPRVHECRAVLPEEHGSAVNLWISAMDSVAGILTLSTVVAPGQLERWREGLERQYGQVGKRVQGSQSMLQWVRRGRMLRLTWRQERGEKVASVSLVDGHVLDGWGRNRARSASMATQPASRTR
jgi:hypothetical protein